jgi:chromosomal replication initiation ATPase DnaA
MPIVQKIISNAEEKITQATGVTVKLIPTGITNAEVRSQKELLKELIENYFQKSWKEIVAAGKKGVVFKARSFYAWICIKHLNQTLTITADEIGNRHHASVINCIKVMKNNLSINNADGIELRDFINQFEKITATTDEKLQN